MRHFTHENSHFSVYAEDLFFLLVNLKVTAFLHSEQRRSRKECVDRFFGICGLHTRRVFYACLMFDTFEIS